MVHAYCLQLYCRCEEIYKVHVQALEKHCKSPIQPCVPLTRCQVAIAGGCYDGGIWLLLGDHPSRGVVHLWVWGSARQTWLVRVLVVSRFNKY